MDRNKQQTLWAVSEAKHPTLLHKFFLLVLVVAGIISIVQFADWWFRAKHIGNIFLFILLSLSLWYGILRLVLTWISFLKVKKPDQVTATGGLSVAIFTTCSPGEPLEMFERTLEACRNITYPHTTYLLDDTRDPAFRKVAEKFGAVWFELVGIPGAKAGKINQALQHTSEDFILILDPDHIPFPNFLDRTLGFFQDEKVGFVQVSQAYYNQYRSFTAKGAAEQTYTFYGATQMGLFGLGSSVALGANCTFRREALISAGGHGIGLAEDLITSIRIHAAGWKSVYNPVVVSRGLVPEDFGSFCKQQLKWSRGVFEVVFVEVPHLFSRLKSLQKLAYLTIGTYYLVGVTSFVFTLIPYLFFLTGVLPARMSFIDFLIHGSLVAIISIIIYLYVQRYLSHQETERGLHWRGMILKYACWPVYLLGFLLGVINAEIPYIPTAKKAVTGFVTPFIRPLVWQVLLFVGVFLFVFIKRRFFVPESELVFSSEKVWGMMGFAFIAVILASGGIYAALEARRMKPEEPWAEVDINQIGNTRSHD
jgi:cellulose synthase (UDP-forming)